MSFLAQVSQNSNTNNLDSVSLGVVFGPLLFRQQDASPFSCEWLPKAIGIASSMIAHYSEIFQVRHQLFSVLLTCTLFDCFSTSPSFDYSVLSENVGHDEVAWNCNFIMAYIFDSIMVPISRYFCLLACLCSSFSFFVVYVAHPMLINIIFGFVF